MNEASEEEVVDAKGRVLGWVLADGEVLAGPWRAVATRVGSIAADGTCSAGASPYQEVRVGRYDEHGVVWSGAQRWEESKVGWVSSDGCVYVGPLGRESLHAVDTSKRCAAALLLLFQPAETRKEGPAGAGLLGAVVGAVAARVLKSTPKPEGVWWETEEGVNANLRRLGPERAARHDIPSEIREKLGALKGLGDPTDIDDEDTGLAFQYLVGLVDGPELDELIRQRTRLKELIERGLWKP